MSFGFSIIALEAIANISSEAIIQAASELNLESGNRRSRNSLAVEKL